MASLWRSFWSTFIFKSAVTFSAYAPFSDCTVFPENQCSAPNEGIIAVETEILPPDRPAGHWGTTPITVDLNTCQKPSWSLTYALIFYWPFRSDQHKTLIKRHVTASGTTARRAAHSFSFITPFFHFCIRYCMLSVLACLLCLNRRSPGRYRWRSRLIGSGLYSPMRLFCGHSVFRSLYGSHWD